MTGHINVVLVLQSCTDPLYIPPGSPSETFPTPSDCTYGVGNITVERDDVKEESFIALNKEVDIGIKPEKTLEDITFHDVKAKPNEVSYVCVCLLFDSFFQYPVMSVFFVMSVFLSNCNSSTFWNENVLLSFGGGVLDGLVCE
jgi:hypothetical protein